jgi:antitoxin (DNA-binding transcriptional repressor) of toxin-antitoxin stability system
MGVKATEASRGFSALLTRVAGGETVEVERHGEVVAILSPPPKSMMSGAALLELIERPPRPDDRFADDVRSLAEVTTSSTEPWPS